MKKLLVILLLVSCLLQGFSVHSAESNNQRISKILDRTLIPTGLGLIKSHGEDYYLGRFSIDNNAVYRTAEDLVVIDAARRMEFKFLSRRAVSGRAFGRLLLEGMKINNRKDALKAHFDNIKRLKNFFFNKSIQKGDVIKMDYHVDFGTRVYLNNRRLGQIGGQIADTREFYGLILNMWLGERPPSQKFKNGLLGQNDDDYAIKLQQQFNKK